MSMASQARRAQFESVVRGRVLRTLIRARMVGVLVVATFASALVLVDPVPVRVALFAAGIGLIATVSIVEARRIDREATEARIALNVGAMAFGQALVVLGSGGIASPFVPAQVLFTAIIGIVAPQSISGPMLVGVVVPVVWTYAWLQSSGALSGIERTLYPGLFVPPGHGGTGPWIAAGIYTLMAAAGLTLGRFVRRTVDDLVMQQVEDRERALEMHAEQNRTATMLTAEIAHELKNPLASVKGLAALVHKDLTGQAAERVAVLRREVDRMQSVLDEFLAYSRPLVPIEAREVDLLDLAREVAAMHEGVAEEKSVRLVVEGESDAEGQRCDPRKLRAVLVNLVQNAIDASEPGGEVTVVLARQASGELRVDVLDRGTGISADVATRLFTVGATTKPRGNGIGLPLSRGLVRQHGGELVLEPREGGGARARITLPRALPPLPGQEAA